MVRSKPLEQTPHDSPVAPAAVVYSSEETVASRDSILKEVNPAVLTATHCVIRDPGCLKAFGKYALQ